MLYALLRRVSSIGLRWFYREIVVEGLEHVPAHGPILVAGNHPNALIDALVIGVAMPRPVRITAKATLLDHPATRFIVRAVGIVPLRRASDERTRAGSDAPAADRGPVGTPTAADASRNAASFAALLDALAEGEAILIFPEGKSHDEPQLAPLKTGLARVALQARDDRGIRGVRIVPVGLTFERKEQPRSRVVAEFGEPIDVAAFPPATDGGVAAITEAVDDRLRDLTLNFDSKEAAERLLTLARVLAEILGPVRPVGDPDPPLTEALRIVRRLDEARRSLPELPPALAARVERFAERLEALCGEAGRAGVKVGDIRVSLGARPAARFAAREAAVLALGGPVALWGRINHWAPLKLARWWSERASRSPEDPAMHTIVSGLAFVLLFYAAQATLVGVLAGPWWALLYLATLPPSAGWDFRLRERLDAARRRVRTFFRFRADPAFRARLEAEADALRAEAEALDAALSERASGRAPAPPVRASV